MKQQQIAGYPNPGVSRIPLQQLIDGLVGNSLPVARHKCSEVVNEVGRGVFLRTVNGPLVSLLDEILSAVITNSRKGDIHISAEKKDQQLVLSITERNNYNGYALSFSIGALAGEASRMGGNLDISSPQKLVTTISFAFPVTVAA